MENHDVKYGAQIVHRMDRSVFGYGKILIIRLRLNFWHIKDDLVYVVGGQKFKRGYLDHGRVEIDGVGWNFDSIHALVHYELHTVDCGPQLGHGGRKNDIEQERA